MDILRNFDLLSVGIAISAILILGFVIFFNNRRSITNRVFLIFALVTTAWSIFNYLSHQFASPALALWLLRFEIFWAVWLTFFLLVLLYVFPKSEVKFPKIFDFLLGLAILTSIINLTPFVFEKIAEFSSDGRASKVINGPVIPLFAVTILAFIASAITILLRKTLKARGLDKKQYTFVFIGVCLMFVFQVIFNFIFPAFLNNPNFVQYGALFVFPFVFLTAYTIIRHGLLNVKVVATEILTFVLSVVTLIEVILASDRYLLVFRSSVFLLVLSFGILLIRSVRKEIQQREQLQLLTAQLEDANEKLKVLDKARAEFISIASHQLRTPPSTIKWYLASILGGDFGRLKPELKDALEKTQLTNNSLISLIDDLLNVSRIERGKMEFLFTETNMEEIIDLTVKELQPFAEMKGLKLEFRIPKDPVPHVTADQEKVRQVVINLIDNAIKYSKKGKITVGLSRTDDSVMVKVSDTGKGLTEEEMKTIFEKYGRGKDSIKYSVGLGLGLYVAKIVVDQHKGKLWAESEGEDKGTTFIFTLPLHTDVARSEVLDLTKSQQTNG